jgi:hypothetical protein
MARIAKSLDTLRQQANEIAPNRSKASDGWIGDEAHSSRTSDHNPNSSGVVCALDLTHDPAHGLDCNDLAEALQAGKDGRIKYVIWNRRIMSGTDQSNPAWVWRPYSGTNPHDLHLHTSVKADAAHYDDPARWDLDVTSDMPSPVDLPVLSRGSGGEAVKRLQAVLMVDGIFGYATETAVREFQAANGLDVDGIVGPYTWRELLQHEVLPPPLTEGWQSGITAAVFGGSGETQRSAYDEHIITDTELGVSLPFRFPGKPPLVEVRNALKFASNIPVVDVGPWMINDPYWTTDTRPVAETCYKNKQPLPSGPHKGEVPSNPAGIDLTPALARALGIPGLGTVEWRLVP